jgi:hypothetical protein
MVRDPHAVARRAVRQGIGRFATDFGFFVGFAAVFLAGALLAGAFFADFFAGAFFVVLAAAGFFFGAASAGIGASPNATSRVRSQRMDPGYHVADRNEG